MCPGGVTCQVQVTTVQKDGLTLPSSCAQEGPGLSEVLNVPQQVDSHTRLCDACRCQPVEPRGCGPGCPKPRTVCVPPHRCLLEPLDSGQVRGVLPEGPMSLLHDRGSAWAALRGATVAGPPGDGPARAGRVLGMRLVPTGTCVPRALYHERGSHGSTACPAQPPSMGM